MTVTTLSSETVALGLTCKREPYNERVFDELLVYLSRFPRSNIPP